MMGEGEKPLHVRVAEALGTCHVLGPVVRQAGWGPIRRCIVHPDENYDYDFTTDYEGRVLASHYDTEWSVTGPLIEQYGISVFQYSDGVWEATAESRVGGNGEIPLVAVCNLILALHAAGKLPKAQP
jgi:hypothetical protein